uniref:Uncharacterized protein n=1 Tax=Cannabis sativa TaxID=3483 RepID=A0A803QI23_CANSA
MIVKNSGLIGNSSSTTKSSDDVVSSSVINVKKLTPVQPKVFFDSRKPAVVETEEIENQQLITTEDSTSLNNENLCGQSHTGSVRMIPTEGINLSFLSIEFSDYVEVEYEEACPMRTKEKKAPQWVSPPSTLYQRLMNLHAKGLLGDVKDVSPTVGKLASNPGEVLYVWSGPHV